MNRSTCILYFINNDEQTTWNLLSLWIFQNTDRESGTNIIPMLLQKSNWKQICCVLNVNQPMVWTLVSPCSCIKSPLSINPNFIFDLRLSTVIILIYMWSINREPSEINTYDTRECLWIANSLNFVNMYSVRLKD